MEQLCHKYSSIYKYKPNMNWLRLEERERARARQTQIFCCIAAKNSNTGSFRLLSHKKRSQAMHSLQHATKTFASTEVAVTLLPTYHVCSNLFRCISIQVKLESDHFMVMSFQLTLYHLITSVTHLQQEQTHLIHLSTLVFYISF